MGIKHMATWKSSEQGPAISLEIGSTSAQITHAQLITLNTPEKLVQAAQAVFGPIDIYFHFNDDGSVAMAIGTEPAVWPEDEEE